MQKLFLICIGLLPMLMFSQSAKKLVESGEELITTKNYNEAIESFNAALAKDESFYRAYAARGVCYQKMNKMDLAVADFNKAYAINNTDKIVLTKMGIALLDGNKLKDADLMLKKALDADHQYPEAIEAEIDLLARTRNFAEALNYTQLAMDLKTTAVNFYRHAAIHDSLNHFDEAEKYYRYSKEKDVKYLPASVGIAMVEIRAGKLEDAKVNVEYVLAKDQFNTDALFARSLIYAAKKNYQEALNDIAKVLLAKPTSNVFLQRGSYYEGMGDYQKALMDYSQIIKDDPKNVTAYLKRASCYEQTKDMRLAVSDYNKVKQIAGNTPEVQNIIKQTKQKAYDLNKESAKPEIEVANKGEKNTIKVPADKSEFTVKGRIKDGSPIKQITSSVGKVTFFEDSLNPEFSIKITEGAKLADITIGAADVYNNISNATYKIERTESDKPIIAIEAPYTSFEGEMSIDGGGEGLAIQGKIKDASLIESIVIDGVNASYNPKQLNPDFSAQINIADKAAIKMMVRDIYGNTNVQTYTLNRGGAMAGVDNPMGNTWVVFIENSKYQNFPSLEGPAKDVRAMKSALANYKISKVLHQQDMTKNDMDKFFSITLRDYVKNNTINSLVIWYAGHGKYVSPTGYWVPSDGKPEDEFSYFGINNLKAAMQSYAGKLVHTLVITDACESGATFLMAMRGGSDDKRCDNFELTKAKSAQVFTSAGFELASDNSQFTKSFVSCLNNNVEPCLQMEKIVKKVTAAVSAGGNQAPKFGKIKDLEDEGGSFFFIKK